MGVLSSEQGQTFMHMFKLLVQGGEAINFNMPEHEFTLQQQQRLPQNIYQRANQLFLKNNFHNSYQLRSNAMLAIALILSLFFLINISFTNAAGVSLHSYLISLTHHSFPPEIQPHEYIPFLVTGSFAPDAFYTCGNAGLSEDIHWPDFLRIAVSFYRNISESSSIDKGEALKLKAFLYGVFTHQVSDSTWHSIGMQEGLLHVISQLEFDGDTEAAHRYIDVAGDFIMLGDLIGHDHKDGEDILSFFTDNWDYPDLNILIEIFKVMGYENMNYYNVFYCLERGKLALRSEVSLYKEFELLDSLKSPWLSENWRRYHEGGVEDWVYSVVECVNHLKNWFDNGVDDDNLCGAIIENQYHTPQFVNSEISITEYTEEKDSIYISPLIPNSQFGGNLLIGDFGLGGELVLAVSAVQESNFEGSVYLIPLTDILPSRYASRGESQLILPKSLPNLKVQSIHSESKGEFHHASRFGSGLYKYSPYKGLNLLLSLSSNPRQVIQVFHESEPLLTIQAMGNIPVFGQPGDIIQVASVETLHNNETGYSDLMIGFPYLSYREKGKPGEDMAEHRGKVLVLSGEKLSYYILNDGIKDVEIDDLLNFEIRIPQEIEVKSFSTEAAAFEHFGSSMLLLEREGLILIGAQSLGLIVVYKYGVTVEGIQLSFIGIINHEYEFVGKSKIHSQYPPKRIPSSQTGLFGSKYLTAYEYDDQTYVAINQHGRSQSLAKLSGYIVILKVNSSLVNFELFKRIALQDIPDNNLAKLGHTISITASSTLLISSSRCVYKVSLEELHSSQDDGQETFLVDEYHALTCTEQGKSGYGSSIEVYEGGSDDGGEGQFVFIGDALFGKRQLSKDVSMNVGRVNVRRLV